MRIRAYRPSDRDACAEVCVRTGAAGADAGGAFHHAGLLPDTYCLPYLELEPGSALVVTDGAQVVGYLVVAPDTRRFIERYRRHWLPGYAARYRPESLPPDAPDAPVIAFGLHPERLLIDELDAYPSHLHIDLLPVAQGRGLGRALIDTARSALAAAGIAGVHLGVDPANTGALAFYRRIGFVDLASSTPRSPILGIATA